MENKSPTNALEALKMTQGIIARLSNNSFLLKGWTITAIVAIMLFGDGSSRLTRGFAIIPLIMFWFLDSYYLYLERSFTKMHKWIAQNADADFAHLFTFERKRFEECEDYFRALCAPVEFGFYMPLMILLILALCLL